MTKWTATVVAAAALALAGCGGTGPEPSVAANQGQDQRAGALTAPARPSQRLVYPWSVVPGGVDSPLAMRAAMREDPVVAAHYAGLNPADFRPETLPAKRKGYVSYRIRDKIYWTRNLITLAAGEAVLTDGQFLVRGRCGNLISTTPREPVAAAEPPEAAMDRPAREAQLMRLPALPGETTVETATFKIPSSWGPTRK